jgi:hypothetical protein
MQVIEGPCATTAYCHDYGGIFRFVRIEVASTARVDDLSAHPAALERAVC